MAIPGVSMVMPPDPDPALSTYAGGGKCKSRSGDKQII